MLLLIPFAWGVTVAKWFCREAGSSDWINWAEFKASWYEGGGGGRTKERAFGSPDGDMMYGWWERGDRVMDARPRSIMDRGAYLDAGSSLYSSREKRMNVKPKLIVNRDRVTTPMNVRTIPTTNRETKTRYFLFSDK